MPKNKFIYASFNNLYKIEPIIFTIWMNILRKVKNSILLFLKTNQFACENIQNEAEKAGISKERIVFLPRVDERTYVDRIYLADLILDTYNYNGHTTG